MPIRNGEEDVFFLDDDGGLPVAPEVAPHGILFERLIDSVSFMDEGLGGITAEQMRRMMIVWMFALAFPDLMPTKPLLIVEGAPGSGKSAFTQLVQLAILGDRKPIVLSRNREDDFPVLLLRSPICVFDNQDSYVDWIPDAVCAYTTTGQFPRRKLFTDAEEYTLKPHAFIAVASKNPASYRREDTADRVLVARLARRDTNGKGFVRLAALIDEIRSLRPQLFGEYLYYVNQIVAEIRAGAISVQQDESFRMADYAALARAVSKVLQWPDNAVEEMLQGIRNEQSAFFAEGDPICELLNLWLVRKAFGKSNIGRLINLQDLHSELAAIAENKKIPFYKPHALMQKLRSPHMEREFVMQTSIIAGTKSFRFWRKTDAQLSLVPDETETEDTLDPEEIGG